MSPGHFAPAAQLTPPFHFINHLEQRPIYGGGMAPWWHRDVIAPDDPLGLPGNDDRAAR
jgi:hypothetical protein